MLDYLLGPAEREQVKVHAASFELQQLLQDKGLGQPRKPVDEHGEVDRVRRGLHPGIIGAELRFVNPPLRSVYVSHRLFLGSEPANTKQEGFGAENLRA